VRLVQTLVATGCKDTADIKVVADHTGVRELKHDEVLIYPNPVAPGSSISARLPDGIVVQRMDCFNINGTRIWSQEFGSNPMFIPLEMAPGVYICRVLTAQGTWNARLIIGN
jgi:hypothetical protein